MHGRYWGRSHRTTQAMSEEQLKAFLEVVKADADLQEKLKGAADLDAAWAIAREAGFVVSKEEWLMYQARRQTLELSDEDLEGVAGGRKDSYNMECDPTGYKFTGPCSTC